MVYFCKYDLEKAIMMRIKEIIIIIIIIIQVGNEQKSRSVRHGSSGAQNLILAHRVLKVRRTKGA